MRDIEANGLRLAVYAPEHDVQTIEWLNDPALQQGFGLARQVTLDSHRAWREAHGEILMWAVMDDSGAHCGNLLLHPAVARRSAYLQVYIGRHASRRQGIAFRALSGVLDYAFNTLGLHRVWLHTLPGNMPAEGLYEKLGFVKEGVEREALPRGKEFVDQFRWSLLDQEWRASSKGRVK